MKLISWDLAGRLRRIPQQVEMLASREPGLVALQEVRRPGLSRLRTLLRDSGLIHQVDSFDLAPDSALLTGPRRYGLLIASRFPLRAWEPGRFDVPWRERILWVDIEMMWGFLAMHTTHIPPGVTNGWIKIEMLEGLYAGLTHPWQMARHRFNTSNRQWPLCCVAQAYVEATLEEWLWPSPPLAISRPSIPGGLR